MTTDKYRVLLVDDNHSLLRLLLMRLTASGWAVTAVGSAEQALAHTPMLLPCLIITDLKMNGIDGMTRFNQTHTRNSSLPVLILTTQGPVSTIVRC